MVEENGNGRITLAVLGAKLDALKQQVEEHDRRQREEFTVRFRVCAADHDAVTQHEVALSALRDDIAIAKSTLDGLKAESRVLSSIASVMALAAGVLGLRS